MVLAMLTTVRRLRRLVHLAVVIGLGVALTLVLWLPRTLGWVNMHQFILVKNWWFRRILNALGAKVHIEGDISSRAGMWVSNHVSWLDIVVLGAYAPIHFVSKSEVARWPVVGFLARQAGTLFMRRGAYESEQIKLQMQARIQEGHGVLFFPEGTTGPGHFLRRFHPRLFAAAIELQQPVIPVAIRYEHEPQPHPVIFYREGQTLLHNLWAVLAEPHLHICLMTTQPIEAAEFARRELAELSRDIIRQQLKLPAPALPPH
jgi:1-acyl-sn-glycerol-3-phosphate acyltransferase